MGVAQAVLMYEMAAGASYLGNALADGRSRNFLRTTRGSRETWDIDKNGERGRSITRTVRIGMVCR